MPDARPIRVLLADDTADIRALLRVSLELDGRFEVVGEAENGRDAIELARATRPDAVVLDLAMPVMDGLEAVPELRRALPAAKIVVLSGFDAEHMAREATTRGADAYAEKGAAFEDLAATIAGLLPGRAPAAAAVVQPTPQPSRPRQPLDELISIFTHELSTPVAVVQGFAATLRRAIDQLDHATIVSSAEAIERNARNLGDLIRSFADARALEVGELNLRLEPTRIDELVHHIVGDLHLLTDPHPVAVDVPYPVEARVDPVRTRQVLTNLLSNAAKFTPPLSPISVSVAREHECAVVRVVDSGKGIAPERAAELFGKFARLDGRATGTGLGLYLSRGIARAHRGELAHEPAAGGGACFVLTLPL